MSIIKDVQENNDPALEPYNNQPPLPVAPPLPTDPLTFEDTPVQDFGQPPVSEPLQLTPEQEAVTQQYNSATDVPTVEPITSPAQQPLTVQPIDTPEQTPQQFIDAFNIGAENNALLRGEVASELLDETRLTQTHIPTVYASPTVIDDWSNNLNESLGRAELLPGQTPTREHFQNQFVPQPQNNSDSRTFNPNALAPQQFDFEWATSALQQLNDIKRQEDIRNGLVEPQYTKPWGDGALSTFLYGIGLGSNVFRGAIIDAVAVRNRAVSTLPKPLQDVLNFSPLTVLGVDGSKYGIIRPNPTYKGSYTFDALRGRQYTFTANINNPNEPIGITGAVKLPTEQIANTVTSREFATVANLFGIPYWLTTDKRTRDALRTNKWITDPTYWLGFTADALLDPVDTFTLLGEGVGLLRRVRPNYVNRAAARVGSGTTEPRVIVTPPTGVNRRALPPSKPDSPTTPKKAPQPITPNNDVTSITLRREIRNPDGTIDVEFTPNPSSGDTVSGVNTNSRPELPSAEIRRPLEPTRYETVQTPNGEVQVPVNEPTQPLQLPGTQTYGEQNWRWYVDGSVDPDRMRPIVEVVRSKPEVFNPNKTNYEPNWSFWKAPKESDVFIPEPIDVNFRVVGEPAQLPPSPEQLALPYGKPYPLTQFDLTLTPDTPSIGRDVRRRVRYDTNVGERGASSVIQPRPTPQPFPELPTPYKVVEPPKQYKLPGDVVERLTKLVDEGDYTGVYNELIQKRIPVKNVRRSLELGRIDEAVNELRKVLGSVVSVTQTTPISKPRIRKRIIKADGGAVYQTVDVNPEVKEVESIVNQQSIVDAIPTRSITVTPDTPATPLSIDAVNDALRPVDEAGTVVAPTNEVNKQLVEQLERLTQTEKRLKQRGASPETLEGIRKQKIELRRAIAEGDVDEVITKPEPVTPAIEKVVLTGTMTFSEVSRSLLDGVPGKQVDIGKIRRVERKLSDVEALAKVLPNPFTGEPLLDSKANRFFKTWNSVKKFLADRGIEDPLYYRLLEREGAPIDVDALTSPEFRVILDKPVPGSTSKQVVVSNPVAQVNTQPSVFDIPDDINSLRRERKRLMREMGNVDDPTELFDKLSYIDGRISNLDISKPENLRVLQDEVIPDTQHGISPEVVRLTQQKLELEAELSNAGTRVQELEIEATKQKVQLEEALKVLEDTADITPHNVVSVLENNLDEYLSIANKIEEINNSVENGLSFSGLSYEHDVAPRLINAIETLKNIENGVSQNTINGAFDLISQFIGIKQTYENISRLVNYDVRSIVNKVVDSLVNKVGYRQLKKASDFIISKTPENISPQEFSIMKRLNAEYKNNRWYIPRESEWSSKISEVSTRGQTLYHGTRVSNWKPTNGGVGEWGNGTYFSTNSSDAVNHANKPLRPSLDNVVGITTPPTVYEVNAELGNVVDVNAPSTPEFNAAVLMSAFGVMDKPEFASFKRALMKPKSTLLKDTIRTPADVYAAVEKFAGKNAEDWTPERVHQLKSRIGERLRLTGIDALSDGSTVMVLRPETVTPVITHNLDETDALGTAVARYNAASASAGNNPGLPTANAAQAEAAIQLQRQMYEETLDKLDEAKKAQQATISKLHETDEQLTELAKLEQNANQQKRVTEGQRKAERSARKLNKPKSNPCEF